jgi:hypothetical protein
VHGAQQCSSCGTGFFIHPPSGAFAAALGAMNGVPARTYTFLKMHASQATGSYSAMMIARCAAAGMAPVCDHPEWCGDDGQSLYLGQTHHLSHFPHRAHSGYMPSGFDAIQARWRGLCSYSGDANGDRAMCNIPASGHSWQPLSSNPGFMCGVAGLGPRTCSETNACDSDEYMLAAPTPTSGGTCAAHTQCNAHQYESKAPTGGSDRECSFKLCSCAGGSAATGDACATHGTEQCTSCSAHITCIVFLHKNGRP